MICVSIVCLFKAPELDRGYRPRRLSLQNILDFCHSVGKSTTCSETCIHAPQFDTEFLSLGNDVPFAIVKELATEVSSATRSYLTKLDEKRISI